MSPRKVLSEHKLERVLPWREFSEVFCREAIAASLTCAIAIAAREDFALVQDYLLEQAVAPDAVNKASPRAQDIRAAPGHESAAAGCGNPQLPLPTDHMRGNRISETHILPNPSPDLCNKASRGRLLIRRRQRHVNPEGPFFPFANR